MGSETEDMKKLFAPEFDSGGYGYCYAAEEVEDRIAILEAENSVLHAGGYPTWAYPKGTCSCRHNPCICNDPMPSIDVLHATLESDLSLYKAEREGFIEDLEATRKSNRKLWEQKTKLEKFVTFVSRNTGSHTALATELLKRLG